MPLSVPYDSDMVRSGVPEWVEMVEALLKGLALGLVAGLPLGPASAAVADTAIRKTLSRALAVGLGGALVDLVYCFAVVSGFGVVFEHSPRLQETFLAVGGVMLILFGLFTAMRRPIDFVHPSPSRAIEARTFLRYVGTGIAISVANPSLVVSWVLLAGTVLVGLDRIEGVLASLGVFAGVLAWFALVAHLAHRGRIRFGARAVWIPRVAGLLLVVYGTFLIGKVSLAWAFGLR